MIHTAPAGPLAPPPLKLHSIKAVSDMTDLSRHAIYRLLSAGKLARVKIGGRTLVPDDALRAFVASHRA